MKIQGLTVYLISDRDGLCLGQPRASYLETGFVIIEVFTEDDVSGIGEVSPYCGLAEDVVRFIRRNVLPRLQATDIDHLSRLKSDAEMALTSSADRSLLAGVFAALSQAAIDIEGKIHNLPAFRILNPLSTADQRIQLYASGGMTDARNRGEDLVEEAIGIYLIYIFVVDIIDNLPQLLFALTFLIQGYSLMREIEKEAEENPEDYGQAQ